MDHRLPLPPSNNRLVRPLAMRVGGRWSARLVSTGEAKAFRRRAHELLPVAPIGGPVELFITFYVPTIASDCSNRIKALEDAMKGRLIHDDVQVAEIHVRKVVSSDPEQVGVVLRVVPADPLEHPELSRRLAKSSIADREAERAQEKLEFEQPEPTPPLPKDTMAGLPESIATRLKRLAKPASYHPEEPEPPEAA